MSNDRQPGWYWVRIVDDKWVIAFWHTLHPPGYWWSDKAGGGPFYDKDIAEIDERPISRSPAAPAGEVEAAVAWANAEIATHTKTMEHMSPPGAKLMAGHIAHLRTLASAAARALPLLGGEEKA